jgi:hypothetical protein
MRTRGVKVLDPGTETLQVDWLVVSRSECRDEARERFFVAAHFRVPHQPWAPDGAFVLPVQVRRSRTRVLFRQKSGLNDNV